MESNTLRIDNPKNGNYLLVSPKEYGANIKVGTEKSADKFFIKKSAFSKLERSPIVDKLVKNAAEKGFKENHI